MPLDLSRPEVSRAAEIVREGCRLARAVQVELIGSPAETAGSHKLTKDDLSPVTVADFAVQALIAGRLSRHFPDIPLVAEEDAAALRRPESSEILALVTDYVRRYEATATPESVCSWIDRGCADSTDRFWALDPIDGTKGFLRGDQYAVALALIERGRVEVGVLGCPNLVDACRADLDGAGSLLIAARGQGAWTMPIDGGHDLVPLRVSGRANPAEARVLRSYEGAHTNTGRIGRLMAVLGASADPIRMDSQAKYALLASGHGDLLFRLLNPSAPDYREKIWDQAAGAIVVEEAGGRIGDLDGRPLDFSTGRTLARNRGVLASNGLLHEAALDALARL